MNSRFKICLLLLVFLEVNAVSYAQDKNEQRTKIYFQANYNQGLAYDGYVQVRENNNEGTHLKLKENLGMDSWISPAMTIGVNLKDKNIFEFTYIRHFFQGSEYLPDPTWYNGTLYAPHSKASIDNTIYRGFELAWKPRIIHGAKTDLYGRVAINYERLKFYVDAPVAAESPKSETFEIFWRQQLPLPTIGLYANHKFNERWSMNEEVCGMYLPSTATWLMEGGDVHLTQSNFDARMNVVYKWKFISLSPGLWYKHYYIKEESTEDKNEFLLNGFGYRIAATFVF